MGEPTVEVATKAILRMWQRHREVWVRFWPRRGQVDAVLSAALRAIRAANSALESSGIDHHPTARASGPHLAPTRRPAYDIWIHHGAADEDAVGSWLEAFAGHLAAAGLAGRVGSIRHVDDSTYSLVQRMPFPQMATFLALSVAEPGSPRRRPHNWNVGSSATAVLAAGVADAAFPGAETYLLDGQLAKTTPTVAAAALRRILPRGPNISADHIRSDPERVLHWEIQADGRVTRILHDPAESWKRRLAQCTDALVAQPGATDLGFVQYTNNLRFGWGALDRSPPYLVGIGDEHLRDDNRHLLSRFVPGPRGVMVLTDAHLERAHDLGGWSVEPLGHGRHLIQARDLATWYAQPAPTYEVLVAARADFGRMILTLADIAANPPPRPGAN